MDFRLKFSAILKGVTMDGQISKLIPIKLRFLDACVITTPPRNVS